MMITPRRVAICGVGYSTVGRRLGLSVNDLVIQATNAALHDSGLDRSSIDGLCSVGSETLDDAWTLGIAPLNWFHTASAAGPAFAPAALSAIAAITSGFCETAIALRIIQQQPNSAQLLQGGSNSPAAARLAATSDKRQFSTPFGAGNPAQFGGLMMQRYMIEYGTTEEQFGAHAVAQRSHAMLNEDALLRDPLSLDQYLASPFVSKPLRLLDCDYPCDSGSAVIFTTEERARDLRQPVVLVESYALSAIRDQNFEIMADMVRTAPAHCAANLWRRTDLKPDDVDTAQLYDGFSVIAFQWLEALGFCGPGEAGPFVEAGHSRLGGQLPLNTDGGACNVGRRHGANFCIEATRQLRGECGARQVADAKVAAWANGVGPFAGAALLVRG